MRNIYLGLVSILSAAVIYVFYYLSIRIIHNGSFNWKDYQYIMERADMVQYLPVIIVMILFLVGMVLFYKGISDWIGTHSSKHYQSDQTKTPFDHSKRIL